VSTPGLAGRVPQEPASRRVDGTALFCRLHQWEVGAIRGPERVVIGRSNVRGEQARTRVRPVLTGMAQKLYNWLNRPTLWQENEALDPDQLRRFNGVLEQISLRPFERDRGLKELAKAYEGGGDFTQLVTDLDSFCTKNGLYQESDVDIVTAEAIKEEDRRLICYERLAPK